MDRQYASPLEPEEGHKLIEDWYLTGFWLHLDSLRYIVSFVSLIRTSNQTAEQSRTLINVGDKRTCAGGNDATALEIDSRSSLPPDGLEPSASAAMTGTGAGADAEAAPVVATGGAAVVVALARRGSFLFVEVIVVVCIGHNCSKRLIIGSGCLEMKSVTNPSPPRAKRFSCVMTN